jgi:hypothetical protein
LDRLRRLRPLELIDRMAPSRARPQVAFKLDYAGGYGNYHND